MKPTVTKISSIPMTALLCCPSCTRLISYERGQEQVRCHFCSTTVQALRMKPSKKSLPFD